MSAIVRMLSAERFRLMEKSIHGKGDGPSDVDRCPVTSHTDYIHVQFPWFGSNSGPLESGRDADVRNRGER